MYYLGPCMYCVVSLSVTNFGKKKSGLSQQIRSISSHMVSSAVCKDMHRPHDQLKLYGEF